MTRVDEWTNAETGVGAAIAAGSHLIKGNCALLVKHPINNKILKGKRNEEKTTPKEKNRAIARSKHKSPIRLDKRVNNLAPKDF